MKKLLRGLCLAISIALIGFALVGCGGGGSSGSGDGYKVEGYIKVDESLLSSNARAALKPVKATVKISELCQVGHYVYETTEDGYYVFNNVPAGHYNICATANDNADLCITAPITVEGNTNVPTAQLEKGQKYTVNLVDKKSQKLNADAEIFMLGVSYGAGKSFASFETKAISKNVKSADAIVKINGIEYKETLAIDNSKTVLTLTVTSYENSSEPPTPPTEDDFAGGTGTASAPYQITNSKHLCNVNKAVEANSKACFIVNSDINMQGVSFTPITGFEGTFNGNNKTISGLTVTNKTAAMFEQTNNATLQNINLSNVQMTATDFDAAGLVASFLGNGTVDNCSVTGTVTNNVTPKSPKRNYTGGVVGSAEYGKATIQGCKFNGTVSGHCYVAGIVGCGAVRSSVSDDGSKSGTHTTVNNCVVTGTIIGDNIKILGDTVVNKYSNNCQESGCNGNSTIKFNE